MPADASFAALEFKPDMAEAARRWAAYRAGSLVDRPLVCVTAPREGRKGPPGKGYRDRVFGDLDAAIGNALEGAAACFYGGEAVPSFWTSFGPDEIAVFCGAELAWDDRSEGTNWSKPIVEDWATALPLRLQEEHPLWQRMLRLYQKAAERLEGKMLIQHLDLHTNMDLLAALRGPQRLCLDLVDQPEWVDRAMASARAVFRELWRRIADAGRMDERGHCSGLYAMEGAAVLQCDFICMMSPLLFRRWVLPALEEEAQIARNVFFHWDGPGALVHERDLMASKGLHTFGYVPTVGPGGRIEHIKHLDLLKRVQAAGKSVQAIGTPDEVKAMHRELRPDRVMYCTDCKTQAEAEELLRWFVRNT
jgi:hypothetical protein